MISERIVRDDVFTSIHIEEFEVMARDTKLGPESITRDIPNVGEESLRNLDEAGIVYIGAEVQAGDILVGKVTPKGETPMTPEEKLLRAIFGEKAADVRDTALKVPPGVSGTIVEVRVFSRRGVDKDERALAIERAEIERLAKDRDDERAILERSFAARLTELLMGQTTVAGPKGMKSGAEVDDALLAEFTPGQWRQITVRDDARMADIEALKKQMDDSIGELQARFESKVEKLQRGDELPPGVNGTVVEVRVFSRRGVDKDERALAIERAEIERLAKDRDDEKAILERSFYGRLHELLMNHIVASGPKAVKPDTRLTDKLLAEIPHTQWKQIAIKNDKRMAEIEALKKHYNESIAALTRRFEDKVDKLQRGDELPPGVMKMVKVFVAVKRKLQPGDKMAGRHGNKGVISTIVPLEDMPYLEDGTPVDIVLNPLGVPSRMNVGQILETHLGWACANLGRQIAEMLDRLRHGTKAADLRKQLKTVYGEKTYKAEIGELSDEQVLELAGNLRGGVPVASPVFDGAREDDIVAMLEQAGLHRSGQVRLTDGRTGEAFERSV
ncbi:MAG: hypothetical protein ACREEV_06400, partial [Dongiaceae bacterium]